MKKPLCISPHGVRRLAAIAVLAVTARVAGPGSIGFAAGSPVSSDPVFQALLTDGRTVSGRLVSFDAGGITLATEGGAKEALPLGRLVKLTRDAAPAVPAWEDAQAVILAQGDRLMRVAVGTATETSLEIRSELLGKLEVPLDCLLGLILAAPGQAGAYDARWDQVVAEPRSTEIVWLANGDRLAGSFLEMDDRKIKMQIAGKPVEVDRSGAVAIGFDPGLVNYPRPKTDFFEATLNDGTRLGITTAKLAEGTIHATTRFGHAVRFALGDLAQIHARTAAVLYLSERKPVDARYVSFIGPSRPFRTDRTVDGHPFQLAGQTFDRGIGTQSRTLLAYRIEPGDRRFQALVGVDERAGPLGSVVFRVLVDGKPRYQSPPLTDRDAPKAIDLDLSGGKFLILATEFGDRGDVRDIADWIEARIIR
jgi:hypothetical protein